MGVRPSQLQRVVRGGGALLAFAITCCATLRPGPRSDVRRYLNDRSFRRATLESSLTTHDNRYARLRLAHYGRRGDEGWDDLPVWNPRSAIAGESEGDARAVTISDAAARGDEVALRAIGEDAFFRYPSQRASFAGEGAARYGLDRGVVRAEQADGSFALAISCAACHVRSTEATRGGAGFIVGAPNDRLEFGALLVAAGGPRGARVAGGDAIVDSTQDAKVARFAAWGRGRVDVTTGDGTEPVRIPDLRPVRFLTHLHASGSVALRSEIDLAIRIETLLITAHDSVLRPPREIALGLAFYLWSLSDTLPRDDSPSGRALFVDKCGSCHRGKGLSGPIIPVEVVGTDAHIARSLERGTGGYRVPSLRGVSSRGPLLHDASVASLEGMFDPSLAGHPYALDLSADERDALLRYLRAL